MPLVTNPSVEERTEPRTKMKTEQSKSRPRENCAEGWTAPRVCLSPSRTHPRVMAITIINAPSLGHGPPAWKKSKLVSCLLEHTGRCEVHSRGWQTQIVVKKKIS